MPTTLSSSQIFIPKYKAIPINEITNWLNTIDPYQEDTVLILSVQTVGTGRRKKTVLRKELEKTIQQISIWEQDEYKFDFKNKKFLCNEEEIYLTEGQIVFLYKWLVLKEKMNKKQMNFLYEIRRRLGKEFLSDIGITEMDDISCLSGKDKSYIPDKDNSDYGDDFNDNVDSKPFENEEYL